MSMEHNFIYLIISYFIALLLHILNTNFNFLFVYFDSDISILF